MLEDQAYRLIWRRLRRPLKRRSGSLLLPLNEKSFEVYPKGDRIWIARADYEAMFVNGLKVEASERHTVQPGGSSCDNYRYAIIYARDPKIQVRWEVEAGFQHFHSDSTHESRIECPQPDLDQVLDMALEVPADSLTGLVSTELSKRAAATAEILKKNRR